MASILSECGLSLSIGFIFVVLLVTGTVQQILEEGLLGGHFSSSTAPGVAQRRALWVSELDRASGARTAAVMPLAAEVLAQQHE